MIEAAVTSKGQVTIPAAIRRAGSPPPRPTTPEP
ncbi:hypothetical protein Talka_00630 [Tepidimonas alkaliphilus]|uniref:SpoVT-AbrB domain-containing protein n=1 Tax=Tepidimonas alkaliphilus TaxID=2588942 RepID=A0A554WBL9_9BURK|nr:hypothetical protein Talka_00630 [Tepidimonas alkaliphilus]